MRFADIYAHNDIKQRLRELVDDNRMPHALLLEGPEGTSKFALARALAQYVHCSNRHDGDACGECPSCRQHQSLNHIDTLMSFPVVKIKSGSPVVSNDWLKEFGEFITESPLMDFEQWLVALDNPKSLPAIYVHEGNELIRRLSYTAHASKYKIVLMWLPERMNEDTANKLLKLVEEPHPDTLFIMTSDNPREILPTIYSRVQRVRVPRYTNAEVAAWLMQNGVTDPQAAEAVAVYAQGSLIKAKRCLSVHADTVRNLDWFIQIMRLAYQRDIAALKALTTKIAGENRESLITFLEYCCRLLRENFIYNLHADGLNAMTESELKFSVNFARFVNERNAEQLYEAYSKAASDIAANANAKIVLFDLSITTILLLKQ